MNYVPNLIYGEDILDQVIQCIQSQNTWLTIQKEDNRYAFYPNENPGHILIHVQYKNNCIVIEEYKHWDGYAKVIDTTNILLERYNILSSHYQEQIHNIADLLQILCQHVAKTYNLISSF